MKKSSARSRLAAFVQHQIGRAWTTANDAGIKTGVGRTTIARILDEEGDIRLDTVEQIADSLGVDVIDILSWPAAEGSNNNASTGWRARLVRAASELLPDQREHVITNAEELVRTNRELWTKLSNLYAKPKDNDS